VKLSDFASDLNTGNRFVKASFAGMAGAGKSRTSTEFVIGSYKDLGYTKPVLVIDNEKGSRFLAPLFREAGIQAVLKDTTSLDDVLTAFKLLRDGETEFVFIDSLSKIWYRYVRDYMAKNRRPFMELQDWGKILPAWQETFADPYVAAHGSIVFTGRGGFSYEKEEDERDEVTGRVRKGQFVKSGVKMKVAGETPYEPDLNIWMEMQQEITDDGPVAKRVATVMKDRSGLIDGQSFANPTYAFFRPFVQFITHVKEGSVAGESSGRNLAPGENFEGFDRRRDKLVALDEIQEEIVKMHPGQSKDDKMAKADLLERLFGTRSWVAVEQLGLEKLVAARNALWLESRGHAYGQKPVVPDGPEELPGSAQPAAEAA